MNNKVQKSIISLIMILFSTLIFWVPFYFVIVNSFKSSTKAADMNMYWPDTFHIIENYKTVLLATDNMLIRAFYNSTLLTVLSVTGLVIVSSLAGFVLQRRERGRAASTLNFLVLAGLMIPPAVVPTIWVLNSVGLFKTLTGLTLVEIALHFPFCAILYKAFTATIPRDIDESAFMDGCGGFKLYTHIIFPLLKPVSSTIIIIQAVNIFNDFVNPLYFLPGSENATVQLTLYNFMSMYLTSWNLLFADVVLISLPPLILFIFFNKKIVAGMTAGSVKG
ncbi:MULTISPECIES: carbohydrate ABC transporter permease [Paenibacillus]|uniref:Carbohydrate ABC transporter permease n=1 Tax=Paenibacillus radicis (ex Xue et al. 2023) TaxID=2972489 RepID=A0ABT1YBU5_9BACL|nr:carbohydrate ABC transporter permease [Paenibacillus radicis (ex Xue et al. 2023)]MCR8630669.1 carbohydrate ABC transporter permease [Paenibacillus radicis (ex Xue et al. 2023)]